MSSDCGSEQAQSPSPRPRPWLAGLVGCLMFIGCFTLCLIETNYVAEYAVRGMPRTEVYEALGHDMKFMEWCCGGSVLSLAISALAGVAAAWCVRRRYPTSASQLDQDSGSWEADV